MTNAPIRFEDGASYEKMMGGWSRLAGEIFLDWLGPAPGLSWLDIGCGNGAFTELLSRRCKPAAIDGVDPSEGMLAHARAREGLGQARFQQGDAMALPYASGIFDAATMALVIFFVPEPRKGVAEMARVLKPGGVMAAYAWDILGGGFPLEPVQAAMRAMGLSPNRPPSLEAAELSALRALWAGAGAGYIETRTIEVLKTFPDFEDVWHSYLIAPSMAANLATWPAQRLAELKALTRANLPAPNPDGSITYSARANAVKGVLAG